MRYRNKFYQQLRNKLISIESNPVKVANGYALGIFLATTPFIGLKVFIALILTSLLKWNKTAAVIGVYHVNTITAPLFYGFSYFVGKQVTGAEINFYFPKELSLQEFYLSFMGNTNIFMSFLIGGLVIGIPVSLLARKILQINLMERRPKNHRTDQKSFALITGASLGLGKEMAWELARNNYNLLLVSLKGEGLQETAEEIRHALGIQVYCYEADLTESKTVYDIAEWANRRSPVNILINNAGIGGTKTFNEASPEYIDGIIQINIRATSLLTRLMLPELMKHSHAYILNVASMASFSPVAYKTVYPASKAFVWSFSRGLYEELKNTNIFVSVIHPGPMMTNADVTERIKRQGFFGKMGLISAEKMAKIAIRQMFRRDSLILPGFLNKINWLLIKIVPVWIRLHLLSNIIKREIHEKQKLTYALNNKN